MTPFTCPEPYVKVQLVLSQRKWKKRKTSARKGMATPYFNKTVTFLVPFSQIQVGCLEEGAGGTSLRAKLTSIFLPLPLHLCLPLPRAWLWCWPSGPGALSSRPSP